ncbi:MAG: BlaI/MecI/CopY family transcriptional regulator [Muribaculaceae bacterium]|nr:BlaI/MecI/CopY family transcriptional regulator [Roseburia sp.]MCM1430544.1 BlaI/MecI/CopY family transcriptional regulator [Muribaculaceae bacterium]MCM1492651.1 BlaI/MecI/CopY family transcriptional regulator [Muribaculaceae bacterium]
MEAYKLGEMEARFADLIWAHAPVRTSELVALCGQAFDWKRTTTYTMLKRLCERGIFANAGGTVQTLISREDFLANQGTQFIEEHFEGSLPLFLTAFSRKNKLGKKDVEELRRLIDSYGEESYE